MINQPLPRIEMKDRINQKSNFAQEKDAEVHLSLVHATRSVTPSKMIFVCFSPS